VSRRSPQATFFSRPSFLRKCSRVRGCFAARLGEQPNRSCIASPKGGGRSAICGRSSPKGLGVWWTKALARKAKDRFQTAESMRGAFALFIRPDARLCFRNWSARRCV